MPPIDVKTYDPSQVNLMVGGIWIPNFEQITIAPDNPRWSFESGSHGEETRVKNNSTRTTITVELPQTNTYNSVFVGYYYADALIPVFVKDVNGPDGGSNHHMPKGTVVSRPESTYNKNENNTREWEIKGPMPVDQIRGNN